MKTSEIFSRLAIAVGVFTIACSSPVLAAGPGQPQSSGTPAPKILVIDRAAILRMSKVGQDIVRQANAYTIQAEKDLKGQSAALRKEGQDLQRQLAILSADVKARKIKEFESRQASLQGQAQKKQGLIQGGFFKARQQVERALGPILGGLMKQRGANLLLDRNAVVLGTVDVDVTGAAIQQLNQKMPTVKMELTPLPPGMQQQAQQQSQ